MPLLRLYVAVPLAYVAAVRARVGQRGLLADVQRRVEALGYKNTLLVTHDPTDNRLVTVLTRPSKPNPQPTDSVLTVTASEAVEEPPAGLFEASGPSYLSGLRSYASNAGPWDAGLNGEEIRTIQKALATETDPRHLTGLAGTLEPWFPVAASLLRVRAAALEPGSEFHEERDKPLEGFERALAEFRAYAKNANRQGYPDDVLRQEVLRAASQIVAESPLLTEDVGPAGFPPPVAALAWRLVRASGSRRAGPQGGRELLRIVDGARVRKAFPPTGEEGFVSPSALKLAMATMKPKVAGIASATRAPSLFEEVEQAQGRSPGDVLAAAKARAALEKADKTLQRRRWADWYAKN